ncbi:MAG: arsenosugar biosynthesis radical SAM (seleno)protein ArsS [Pseudomonadota bacterium]
MQDTRPLLLETDFPPITRHRLLTLQVNLGYLCNISCTHCHVNAGPTRTELMDSETLSLVLDFAAKRNVGTLDLTGGSPEMNPGFRDLVRDARAMNINIMDRCNPTILVEPGYEDLAQFLAEQQVQIVASMPCYQEENVDGQRGKGVYRRSIEGLKRLNALGYGHPESGLTLNLVYNPDAPILPPPQQELTADYKDALATEHGIVFNDLYCLANMPISRFGARLLAKGDYADYMTLLRDAFVPDNLQTVMCRSLISIDYRGYVYDCDFNQMLAMPLASDRQVHLSQLLDVELEGYPINIGEHCYGCTAGQGSSCGGALNA